MNDTPTDFSHHESPVNLPANQPEAVSKRKGFVKLALEHGVPLAVVGKAIKGMFNKIGAWVFLCGGGWVLVRG